MHLARQINSDYKKCSFTFVLFMTMVLTTGCGKNNEAEKEIDTGQEQQQNIASHSYFPVLSQSNIEEIRKAPSKINQFYTSFKKRAQEFLPVPFKKISDIELFSLYSAIVAYSMAPYGGSREVEFVDLLAEEKLDCDNYAVLTYYLFRERDRPGELENVKLRFIGWDGGFIGNHSQIIVESQQHSLLLDPTIGIAAITDFNSISSGKPLHNSLTFLFTTRDELKVFREKVIRALKYGLYKPSDLIYNYEDFDEFTDSIRKSNTE